MAQVSKSQCIELQSNPGFYLVRNAAYAWDRAVADFSKDVLITGAWRSYETQERIFLERYQTAYIQYAPGRVDARSWRGRTWYRKPGTAAAAVPGTSNHGGGVAVDVKTARQAGDPPYSAAVVFTSWTDADRTRFLRAAAEHGWYDAEGRSVNELWHLTYYPHLDKHRGQKPKTTTQEVPDMDATQAKQLSETRALVGQLKELLDEVHAGTAPKIDKTAEIGGEKITLRTAIKETRLAVTGQLAAAVQRGVTKALADVTGVDKAALTKGVVAEVSKAVEALTEGTEYVLTPKEK